MNKMLKQLAFAVPALLLLSACSSMGPDGKPEPSLEQMLTNAEAQFKATEAMGYGWTSTSDDLEAAKKAKADLDTDKAVKLARKVLKETKLAQEQAKAGEAAKPHYPM